MKKTALAICIGLALSVLQGTVPSFAAGDCPPSNLPFYTCVLENVMPVGGPGGGGGGINIIPKYMMAVLP
jgi:hypothetical protein